MFSDIFLETKLQDFHFSIGILDSNKQPQARNSMVSLRSNWTNKLDYESYYSVLNGKEHPLKSEMLISLSEISQANLWSLRNT